MSQDHTAKVPFDSKPHAQLIRYVAYGSLWVLGIWAFGQGLFYFQVELKPLVLAFFAASLLEWVVQMFEWLIWKTLKLVTLLLRKAGLLVAIFCQSLVAFCHWLYTRLRSMPFHRDVRTEIEPWLDELCVWDPLWRPWHGSYAGRSMLLRSIAVTLTLALLSLGIIWLTASLIDNVSDLKDNFSGYVEQLMKYRTYINENLDKWVESLPDEYRNDTRRELHHLMDIGEKPFQTLEGSVVNGLQDILTQLGSMAVSVVFFLLYTVLWLFTPVHFNSFQKTFQKNFLFTPTARAVVDREGRVAPLPERCPSEDEPINAEFQDRIYHVVQSYFGLLVLVNGIYGTAVFVLLTSTGVDVPVFIATVAFLLSFIPELGTIVATVLPVPIVALQPVKTYPAVGAGPDHNVNLLADWSHRSTKLCKVLVFMVLIKFVVGNVLASVVMGKNKTLAGALKDWRRPTQGERWWQRAARQLRAALGRRTSEDRTKEADVTETHPVVILAVVVLAGKAWGPVGMLISVPLVSLVRLALNAWYMEEGSAGAAEP